MGIIWKPESLNIRADSVYELNGRVVPPCFLVNTPPLASITGRLFCNIVCGLEEVPAFAWAKQAGDISDGVGEAADLLEKRTLETQTFYAFPDSHWIKLRTNNPLERLMREIRRRTNVVGAFPDGKS